MAAQGADSRQGEPGFAEQLLPEELEWVRQRGTVRRHARGAALFHERQPGDDVVVIAQGLVKLSTITPDGQEVLLAIRGPGDLIGEQSTIDGHPRSATATALEEVVALVLPASDFQVFLQEHPRVALSLLRVLSRRLRDSDAERRQFAEHDATGRLVGRLLELAERFGDEGPDGIALELPVTQEEPGARDSAGNPVAAATTWTFTTR